MANSVSFRSAADRWGLIAIWLHWSVAFLVLSLLAVGYVAEHSAAGRSQRLLYEVHFSLGLLTFLLAIIRLGWRLADRAPHHIERAAVERWAAGSVHVLLYLAMFAALVSGTVNFLFLGPVRVFGLIEVPRFFDPEADEWVRALAWYVHYYSYWLLLFLTIAHAGAALHHHFIRRDNLLRDFLPGRR